MSQLSLDGLLCIDYVVWPDAHCSVLKKLGLYMATIDTSQAEQHVGANRASEQRSIVDLRIDGDAGGLIILGPTIGPMRGVETILSSPGVEPIEVVGQRMVSWKTVSAEVLEVSRLTSRAIRSGQTAVVYLDAHLGEGAPIPAESHEFVCARLGQIMIGLADVPAYVALHSERMARALVVDSLGDEQAPALGRMPGGFPVWELTVRTMFPGIPVAACPGDRAATAAVQMFDWFEGRRR